MRVKDAVLIGLTKGQLRRLADAIGLDGVDRDSTNALTEALSKDPRATAELVLRYLPDAKLIEVSRLVGQVASPTRAALIEAALQDPADMPSIADDLPARHDHVPSASGNGLNTPAGSLVTWNGLVGVVDSVNGRELSVKFDGGARRVFTADSGVLERLLLKPGAAVTRAGDSTMGVLIESVPTTGFPTWRVQFPSSLASVAEMGLRPALYKDPVQRMKVGQLGTALDFNLRSVAADYWTAHLHNELVSLAHARVDLKPHQVSVVHRVVSKYPHRFLLCDEVGLGKTIEAAMVLKELRARRQAARVLILVPSGIARQWQFELKTKFNETFAIYNSATVRFLRDKGVPNPWTEVDSIIASHTWASHSLDRIREIAQVAWDMVIVDEAHHARVHADGTRTLLVRLVQELVARPECARRAALMLTATPLQLHQAELYSLVEMLDPILFSSPADFASHIDSLAGLNRTVERLEGGLALDDAETLEVVHDAARWLELAEPDAAALLAEKGPSEVALMLRGRHRLSEVMIRNRRSVVHGFQPRRAFRWEVSLSPQERHIHELMEQVFERGFRLAEATNQNAVGFLMVVLQKLLASSPQALQASLMKRRARQLATAPAHRLDQDEADDLLESDAEAAGVVAALAPSSGTDDFDEVLDLLEALDVDTKAEVLVEKVSELVAEEPQAKILIFTEFRETQNMLTDRLGRRWSVHQFHGQMSPEQKDASVEAFRSGSGVQLLVSTEAGGEGRNFQFCHHLVNYDLPWNPMRVEQRIGRIDRIGQDHPITIFNFHVQGTIEGRILDVLERRIRVFEEAVGGLDPILGSAEEDIKVALRLAANERDRALDELGKSLEAEIRKAREAERQLEDFIMQDKSYSAAIAQTALQTKSPISQVDFERFLERLLASAKTWVGPRQPSGERRIVFHVPFIVEHPELMREGESRRVCFDPRLHVESELVEYLGFGHPIVDCLVTRVMQEPFEGMAAVREVPSTVAPAGWQFNWLIDVGGLKPKTFVLPVFVGDSKGVDLAIGRALLLRSRAFEDETIGAQPAVDTLETALELAESEAVTSRDRELIMAQQMALARADIEEKRLRSLHRHRTMAAEDRISACSVTLDRLRVSLEPQVRQAIPLWEANLSRAEGERRAIESDLQRSLMELVARRNPVAEYTLLNIARIEPTAS